MTTTKTLTVVFDDIEYQISHGKSPKGYGAWAFGLTRCPPIESVLWTQGSMTYGEAKKHIKARLQEQGVTGHIRIYAQP